MKILHVCESIKGGPASYLNEILPAQVERYGSSRVHLLCPETESTLITVPCDISTFHRARRGVGAQLALATKFLALLRQQKPEIVHFHSTFAGLLRPIAATLSDAAILYCAHGWSIDPDRNSSYRAIYSAVEKGLQRFTTRVINLSPHETRFLEGIGFDAKKMVTIVSGVSHVAPELTSASQHDQRVNVLFAGRLDTQKGADTLAASLPADEPENFSLTVVGSAVVGSAEPVFPSWVRRIPWMSRSDLSELIGKSDAVLMPSRWEGLPLLALEAFAHCRPVLASRIGPFPFLLENETCGRLFEMNDSASIFRLLNTVTKMELEKLGRQAKHRYERDFTAERMNEELMALYEVLT